MGDQAAVTIRPGAPGDALCVGVLATQVFLDTYATDGVRADLAREVLAACSTAATLARLADPARTFLLAERAGHLVGFAELAAGQPCPLAAADTLLSRLYVQRPSLGRGLGRALLRAAEDLARAAGAPALWLSAWEGNRRAIGFYRAQGYAELGATTTAVEGQIYRDLVFIKGL